MPSMRCLLEDTLLWGLDPTATLLWCRHWVRKSVGSCSEAIFREGVELKGGKTCEKVWEALKKYVGFERRQVIKDLFECVIKT